MSDFTADVLSRVDQFAAEHGLKEGPFAPDLYIERMTRFVREAQERLEGASASTAKKTCANGKCYLIFANTFGAPMGGWGDFRGYAETLDEGRAYLAKLLKRGHDSNLVVTGHIVDMEALQVVFAL